MKGRILKRLRSRKVSESDRDNERHDVPPGRRRGVLVIMLLLASVQAAVFFFRSRDGDPDRLVVYEESRRNGNGDSAGAVPAGDSSVQSRRDGVRRRDSLFFFDPNLADSADFTALGFSPKQSAAIVRYRSKGGRFRKKEDFSRLYVVSDGMYTRLEPYIRIAEVHKGKGFSGFPERPSSSDSGSVPQPGRRTGRADSGDAAGWRRENPRTWQRGRLHVDLNTADSASLDSLPGIGPYFAKKIIRYRQRLGFYVDIRQLLEIEGFGEERYLGLKDAVYLSDVQPLDIATADSLFMARHPYIGPYRCRAIRHYVVFSGSDSVSMDEILKRKVIVSDKSEYLKKIFR